MNNTTINTQDAAILSEIVYLQNTFESAVEQQDYKNLENIFYDSNGKVRANIDADFAKRLTMHQDYYQNTLEKYRLVEVSSRLLNSSQQATGYYGIAVEAIANPGEIYIYNRGTETSSIQGFLQDFTSDIALATGEITNQADAGVNFVEHLLDRSQDQELNYNLNSIGFGGHSLGGSLAQILSVYFYDTGMVSKTHTFEAYGTLENITEASNSGNASLLDLINRNASFDLSAKYQAIDTQTLNGLIDNYIHPSDRIATASEHIGSVTEIASAGDADFGLGLDYHRIDNYLYQAYDNNGELMPNQLNIDAINQLYNTLNLSLEGFDQAMAELSKTAFDGLKMREFGGGLISNNPEDLHKFVEMSLQRKAVENLIKTYNDRFNTMENYNQSAFAGGGDSEIYDNILGEQLSKIALLDFDIGSFNNIVLNDSVNQNFIAANVPRILRDPLIVDLDGDGIETTSADNKIMFDHNGDGIKYATGWVAADDAFLVRDINQNGFIDNGTELFGDNTVKQNGQKAQDSFDALADLDSNQDGIINAEDTAFSSLKLWQDHNQDGLSQANELSNITATDIDAIDLNVSRTSQETPGGVIFKTGDYSKKNGAQSTISALNFTENRFYRQSDQYELVPDNAINIQGYGALNSLYYSANQNPELFSALQQFIEGQNANLSKNVLLQWAKTAENFTASLEILEGVTLADGTVIQAQVSDRVRDRIEKIAILEAVNGVQLIEYRTNDFGGYYQVSMRVGTESSLVSKSVAKGDVLILDDGFFLRLEDTLRFDLIDQAYYSIEQSLYEGKANLNMYSAVKEKSSQLLQQVNIAENEAGNITFDWSEVKVSLADQLNHSAVDTLKYLSGLHKAAGEKFKQMGFDIKSYAEEILSSPSNKILAQLSAADELRFFGKIYRYAGTEFDQIELKNTLRYSSIDQVIYGLGGDDVVYAGDGDDRVSAGNGDNEIDVGNGDNQIITGAGDDDISAGDGNNIISAGDGNNEINVGEGDNNITSGSGDDYIELLGNGNNSIIAGDGDNDIYILGNSNNRITTGNGDDDITGGDGNNTINASDGDNEIYADDGNNLIKTGDGDDYIDVGDGNNTIVAGDGSNRIDVGDGSNTINAGDGDNEVYALDGNNFITTGSGDDYIAVYDGNNTIIAGDGSNEIEVGDGDNFIQTGNDQDYISVGSGNNTITAGSGDDNIVLSGGNNEVSGGLGNDTYEIGMDSAGTTRINNADSDGGEDSLVLDGASAEDLWFYREMSHLMIRNLADEHSVTVENWFDSPDNQIDQVMTDEMVLHQTQIDQLIQAMATFNVDTGAGEIVLNPEQKDHLSSIIANTWSIKQES